MEFRWENRVVEKKTDRSGKLNTVMKPIPIIDMMGILIMRFSGYCLKRTPSWGIVDVAFNL
jgi:hypothetical protein